MNNLRLLAVKLLLLAWQWTWTQEATQSKMLQSVMSVVTSDVESFCR